jgi:hypothetical protein
MIALAGFWVIAPALHGDWLGRDRSFLGENGAVRDPDGLWKIWLAPQDPEYSPLRTSVQWLEWRLFGLDPLGYHLANAGLQLLGAILLWRLLGKAGVRLAWLAGLALMVHPLAVATVARIPEPGSVLALPLLLLAALAWLENPDRGMRSSPYLAAFACFVLALCCHASAALFPVLLVLHAWWRHRRVTRADWRAIEPFFAAMLMFVVVAMCLRSYSTADAAAGGFLSRLAAGGGAIVSYLLACLAPFHLVPSEPRAYLPLAVLIGVGVAGLDAFIRAPRFRGLAPPVRAVWLSVVGVALAAWAVGGRATAGDFTDNAAFWGATVDRDPDAAVAQYNLGLVLVGSHRLPEAIDHFSAAVRLQPDYAEAQSDLAIALSVAGRPAEAIPHFARAVELNADNAQIRYNYGLALRAVGRPGEARAQWEAAERILHGGHGDAQ